MTALGIPMDPFGALEAFSRHAWLLYVLTVLFLYAGGVFFVVATTVLILGERRRAKKANSPGLRRTGDLSPKGPGTPSDR